MFNVKFDPHHIVWDVVNMLIPQMLPWRVAQVTAPVADPPKVPWLAAIGMTVVIALVLRAVIRRGEHAAFCRKIGINASFIRHNIIKGFDFMDQLPFYGRMGDWRPLDERRDELRRLAQEPGVSEAVRSYTEDVVTSPNAEYVGDVRVIWDHWRRGDANFLDGRPLAVRSLWVLSELALKRERQVTG